MPPKSPYFFSLTLTERPLFLPTFTQWPPISNKLLVTEIPWHIFVTQRPLIFAFSSQTSDNFRQKIWIFRKISTNLMKCWEIFGHFGPESSYFLMHFTDGPPIFVRFVTERPPFLTQFVTERPLHPRCLVALVRHFHMWVPPPRGQDSGRGRFPLQISLNFPIFCHKWYVNCCHTSLCS